MNVKNDDKTPHFLIMCPVDPVPDIAAKIEPINSSKAAEKGMCGDRPSLEMKIATSNEDGKRHSNKTRPTTRDKSLPTCRSAMTSKSGSKNPYGAGEDISLYAKKSGSGAKIDHYKHDGRRRNSVNGNGASVSFIDLT